MEIVNWQSVLTEHQVHLLRAISSEPGVRLRIVTAQAELDARRMQGWKPPDVSGLDVVPLSGANWVREGKALLRSCPDAQHLFCGLWADRRLFLLLLYARLAGRRLSLMSEPYADVGVDLLTDGTRPAGNGKVWLRRGAYRTAGLTLGSAIDPLFAISPKAVLQFKKAGFRAYALCPFGYFVQAQESRPAPDRTTAGGLRLAFVGALLRRKGLDIACRAIQDAAAAHVRVALDVYGPGETAVLPERDPSIRYRGVIPFGQTQQVVVGYDALLVPSRFDGWGVVVNEALLQGVPVVASDAVGAAQMLRKSGAGFVFPSEQPAALAMLLTKLARDPALLAQARGRALALRPKLMPATAARYMLDCYAAVNAGASKPACPWY